MSTLERDLEQLRASLRAAAVSDLTRRRRRRRLAGRLAVVPALALAGGGVAAAVDPPWGDPAPAAVQQTFDASGPATGAAKGPLRVWARDGDRVLYGTTTPDGRSCVSIVDSLSNAITCRRAAERPDAGTIRMYLVGGATDRAGNAAAGEVSAPGADTVSLTVPGEPQPTVVPVGHDGFFVAQLPDSTLARPGTGEVPRAPELTVVARDAAGDVVARGPAGG
jgi:hypothetical protein